MTWWKARTAGPGLSPDFRLEIPRVLRYTLLTVPLFVSDLETQLGTYVHPKLEFRDVLNEVLPQLASRGIWKDLTFEGTISLESTDRFFTLPESADSVLFGMSNNRPTSVQPLWQGYVATGASSGRLGEWYGVEDAGFVSTKSVLSAEYNYCVYALPDFRWGEMDDLTEVRTDSPFIGTETVTFVYENWEGVVKTVTDTLAASSAPQLLSPRAIRNIQSISYTGVTVPVRLIAVPIKHFGLFSAPGGSVLAVEPIPELPSAYTTLLPSPPTAFLAYSLTNDAVSIDSTTKLGTTVTDASIADTTYAGPTPVSDHPVMLLDTGIATDVLLKEDTAEDAKSIAVIGSGTGIIRYRAFRVHTPGNTLHLLFRRKIPKFTSDADIVYLDNISALKYAILANTAEYNNDQTAAKDWWDTAEGELNRELSKSLGAATPNIQYDPSGGQGSIESFQ